MHGKIILYRLRVLIRVHRDDYQPVTREITCDVIDRSLLAAAVGSPGGPELQQHHLAPKRVAREGLAPKRPGRKLRRGLSGLCNSKRRKKHQKE